MTAAFRSDRNVSEGGYPAGGGHDPDERCEHRVLLEDCPQCAADDLTEDARWARTKLDVELRQQAEGLRASQSWIATECRCLKCGETFIESDPNPIHWGREDGAECGGKGEIVGSWR